jgi:hypothetical protein
MIVCVCSHLVRIVRGYIAFLAFNAILLFTPKISTCAGLFPGELSSDGTSPVVEEVD